MSSLFLHSEPFLSLWCAMKSGFYTTAQGWPAQWLDQEEAPKHYPKPDLHQKKGHSHCFMVTVWCSAAGLIHYNFLIPSEKITSENYPQQNLWDSLKTARPTAGIILQNGPSSSSWCCLPELKSQNPHFRSWTNWATKFYFICYIHLTFCQPTTTSSSI